MLRLSTRILLGAAGLESRPVDRTTQYSATDGRFRRRTDPQQAILMRRKLPRNGPSAFAVGTALRAPHPTFAPRPSDGSRGSNPAVPSWSHERPETAQTGRTRHVDRVSAQRREGVVQCRGWEGPVSCRSETSGLVGRPVRSLHLNLHGVLRHELRFYVEPKGGFECQARIRERYPASPSTASRALTPPAHARSYAPLSAPAARARPVRGRPASAPPASSG